MNISALDEQGNTVDWWFIYKVPKLSPGPGTDGATGYEYVYYDSKIDASPDVTKRTMGESKFVLNSDKGALNLTLHSVFGGYPAAPDGTAGWLLYNDEMPADVGLKDDGTKGHTKGVLAFDTASKTAYWLLHSWPKFVDPKATTDPTPMYGQTYLCLTISLDTARRLATQMISYQEPQIFFPNTADLPDDDPIYKLANAKEFSPEAGDSTIDLKTLGGMPFSVIAKNREWNQDFWNDLVGPTLKDDMDDETWIRGPVAPVADSDGIHKTFDIKYINLGPLGLHLAWPESHDHAKWGITLHLPWICVGDINRMISQRKRGGGTAAFQCQTLWSALSKSNLVLAPPGHTRTDATKMLQDTHEHHSENPPKTPAPAPAPGKARVMLKPPRRLTPEQRK
ncbi:MAG: deoxyribonuclease II family protein [Bacteroidetes bacterium]|nr:deoxyribonuclease II family protein [Bacteroidota bacterium]